MSSWKLEALWSKKYSELSADKLWSIFALTPWTTCFDIHCYTKNSESGLCALFTAVQSMMRQAYMHINVFTRPMANDLLTLTNSQSVLEGKRMGKRIQRREEIKHFPMASWKRKQHVSPDLHFLVTHQMLSIKIFLAHNSHHSLLCYWRCTLDQCSWTH